MDLSCEDGEDVHRFWYARVVKILHLFVCHLGTAPQRAYTHRTQHMDVLWVRWFGLDADARGGWSKKHPHGIAFIPRDETGMFGFLDPAAFRCIPTVNCSNNYIFVNVQKAF